MKKSTDLTGTAVTGSSAGFAPPVVKPARRGFGMPKHWLVKTLMVLAAFVFIYPLAVTLIESLRYGDSFPTAEQYGELLITNNAALPYFWNSVFYSLVITVSCVVLSFPLGFVFAKVKFPGRNIIFFIFIIAMMLPFQSIALSMYIQLRDLHMLNSRWSLIMPLVFSPFAVFLFRQFIKSVPPELLDYTTLETSSAFKVLWYAVLPQTKPAIAAVSVMVFCDAWNMVEPVRYFINFKQLEIRPMSVILSELPSKVYFSAAAVYIIPIVLLFLLFKDSLVASMERFHWD
ncbi:MAG: carbohydrate ABC transporter permease [Oscillospiraceae bacterium]|jgi:multiple sugar transport system permease protein|nr:carbohydrate ABC transporter permease [Oscillospiraceae bacterium]